MADFGVGLSSSAESASACSGRDKNTSKFSDLPSSSCKELIEPHVCDDLSSDETEFLKVLASARGEQTTQANNSSDEKRLSTTLPMVNGSCSNTSRDLSLPIKPFELHEGGSNHVQPSANPPTSLGSHWMHNYVITFPETSPLVPEKLFTSRELSAHDSIAQPTADEPANGDTCVLDCNASSKSGLTLFSNCSTEPNDSGNNESKPSREISRFGGKSTPAVAQSTTTNLTCSAKPKSEFGKGRNICGMSASQDSNSGASPIPEESLFTNSDFQDFSGLSFNFNLPLFTPPPNGMTKTSSAKSKDTSLPLKELEVVEDSCVSNCTMESPIQIMLPPNEVKHIEITRPADEDQLYAPIVENCSTPRSDSQENIFRESSSTTNLGKNTNSFGLEERSALDTSQESPSPIPATALSSHLGNEALQTKSVSQNNPEYTENPREIDDSLLADVNCEPCDFRSKLENDASTSELEGTGGSSVEVKESPIHVHSEDSSSYYDEREGESNSVGPSEKYILKSVGVSETAVESVQAPQAMKGEKESVFDDTRNLTETCVFTLDADQDISSSIDVNEPITPAITTKVVNIASSEHMESNIRPVDLKGTAATAGKFEEINPMLDSEGPTNEAWTRSTFSDDSKSSEKYVIASPRVEPPITSSLNDSIVLPPTPKQVVLPDVVDATFSSSSWNSPVPASSLLVKEVLASSQGVQLPCDSYGEGNTLQNSYFDGDPLNCEDFSSDYIVDNFSTDEFCAFDEHDGHQNSEALCLGGENVESASSDTNKFDSVGCLSVTSELSEKSEDSHQKLVKLGSEECASGVSQQLEKLEEGKKLEKLGSEECASGVSQQLEKLEEGKKLEKLDLEIYVSETSQPSEKLEDCLQELDKHSPSSLSATKIVQKSTETLKHEHVLDTSDTKTNFIDAEDPRQPLKLNEHNQNKSLDSDDDFKVLDNQESDNLKGGSETETSVPSTPVNPTPEEVKDKKPTKGKKVTNKKSKVQSDTPDIAVGGDVAIEKGELEKEPQKVLKGKKKGKKNKFDSKDEASSPLKKEEPPAVERRRLIRGQKWRQDVSKLRDYQDPLVPLNKEKSVEEIILNLAPLEFEADIKSDGGTNLSVALNIDTEISGLSKCSDSSAESKSDTQIDTETVVSGEDNSEINLDSCTSTANKMSQPSSYDKIHEVSDTLKAALDSLTPEDDIIVTETPQSDNSATESKKTDKESETVPECFAATSYTVSNLFCDTGEGEGSSQPSDMCTLPAFGKKNSPSEEESTNFQDMEKTLLLDPITSDFSIKDNVSNITLDSSYEYSSENSEDNCLKDNSLIRKSSDELITDSIGDYHHSVQMSGSDKSSEEDLPTDSTSIGFHPLNKTQTRILISTSQSPFQDSPSPNTKTERQVTVPVRGDVKREFYKDDDFPIVVRVSEAAEEEQAETEYLSSTSDSSNSQTRVGVCADGRVSSSDSWQTDDSDADVQDWEVLRTGVAGQDCLQNEESIQNLDVVQATYSFSVGKANVDLDNTKDSIDSNEEYTHYVFDSGGIHSSPIKLESILDSTDGNGLDNDNLANVGTIDNDVPEEVLENPSFEDLPTVSGTFDVSYIKPAYRISSQEDTKPACVTSTKHVESAPNNLNLGEILYDEVCQCITANPRHEESINSVEETENASSDDELVVPSLFEAETVVSQDKDSLHEQLTPPESPLPGSSPRPTSAASSGGQGSDERSCSASREASESPIRGASPLTEASACLLDARASPSINQNRSPGFISESLKAGTAGISPGIAGLGTSKSPLSLPSVRKMSRKKVSSKKIQQRLERRDTDMLRMPPHVTSLEKPVISLQSSKNNRSLDSLDRMSDSEEDVTEATDTTLKETRSPQSFRHSASFDNNMVDLKGVGNLSFSSEIQPGEILVPYGQANLDNRCSHSEEERPNDNGLIQRWEAVQRQALSRQQQSRELHSLHASIKHLHLGLDALQQHYTASSTPSSGAGQQQGDGGAAEVAKKGEEEEEEATNSTSSVQHGTPAAHSLQQLQDRLAIAQAREDRLSEIQAELSQLSLKIHHHSTESGHQLPQLQHQLHHLYQQADHISHCISGELSHLSAACSALEAWQRQAEELRNCLQQDDSTLSRLQEAVSGGPAALSRLQLEDGAAAAKGDSLSGTARGLAKILAQGQASNGPSGGRSFGGSSSRLSDSGTSGYESCSSDDLSERERRLHALKRLAAELEGTLHPHSLAWTNIKETISFAESELSSLQKRCRDLLLQTAERVAPATTSSTLCTRASRRRAAGNQSRITRAGRTSPSRSSRNKVAAPRNGWLWRVVRFALPIQAALLLLFCVSCLLEPSCCDSVNTLNMDLGLQVRFIHGLPPV